MTGRRLSLAALTLATALVMSACNTAGIRLTNDTRLSLVTPQDGTTVTLPMKVRVSVHGVRLMPPGSGDGYYLAVLVDRAPMHTDGSLLDLVDQQCRHTGNGCATLAYFADHDVYLTSSTQLTLSNVPETALHRQSRSVHQVDVVLIDGASNSRVGDSLAEASFRVGGLG